MKRNIASHVALLELTLAVFLIFGRGGFAAELPPPAEQKTVRQAYEQLLSTRTFAFGGIGFAGTISEGEKAFRIVAESPNALDLFETLLQNGRAEGRLYALCGIRKLARPSFEAQARTLVDAEPRIITMSGCLLSEELSSNVVARIAAGSYDANIGIAQIRH